ncbi:MAG: hypothetical protein AAGH83_08835 [Pseudomonadota bacterium]
MKLTSIVAVSAIALATAMTLPVVANHPATVIWTPTSVISTAAQGGTETSPILCGFSGQNVDQAKVTLVASSAADCVAAGGAAQ